MLMYDTDSAKAMTDPQKNLEALGLSDKEAKVYLASLELGAATAQQIAAKAAVVRPTAYVAIGGLVKRGLMSQFTKGKKQYFQAEKPDRLAHLLDVEKRRLAEREVKLKEALPMLESLVSMSGEKPEVKYYEGMEGLDAMRKVLFESQAKEIAILVNSKAYDSLHTNNEASAIYNYQLKKSGIKGRLIRIGQVVSKNFEAPNFNSKILSKDKFPFKGEVSAFGDYVALISYQEKPHGFLIKSKHIVGMVTLMFDCLWKSKELKDWR